MLFNFFKKKKTPGNFINAYNPFCGFNNQLSIKDFYTNPVVHQCVDLICTHVQRVDWYVVSEKNAKRELFSAERILQDSFYWDSTSISSFKRNFIRDYIVFGFATVLVQRKNKEGIFDCLSPIKLRNMPHEIEYDDYGKIQSVYFTNEGERIPAFQNFQDSDSNSFIGFMNRDPLFGSGYAENYLECLDYHVQTMNLLTKRANDIVMSQNNVKHIISANNMSPQHTKELIEQLNKGGNNVVVTSNAELDLVSLDPKLIDIYSKISNDDIKRTIAGVFGVPVALLASSPADGAKYANNFKESRASFFEDTIIPKYLTPLQDCLNAWLFPEDIKLKFDLDSIDCLREKRFSSFSMLKDIEFLTVNEKRELCGFEPMEDKKDNGA